MKISEFVEQLMRIKADHGDLDVHRTATLRQRRPVVAHITKTGSCFWSFRMSEARKAMKVVKL